MATRNPPPPCPNADQHTPAPANYTGWHHWATRMSRTHNQVRCPGCGLYEIWIPKVARSASAPESPQDGRTGPTPHTDVPHGATEAQEAAE